MLWSTYEVNWDKFPVSCKRGSACIKNEDNKWFVDTNMPILTGKYRKYVDDLIYVGE